MALKGCLRHFNYLALFLILIGIFLMMEIFSQLIGLVIIKPLLPGYSLQEIQQLIMDPTASDLQDRSTVFALKLFQLVVSVGRFILTAWFFMYLTKGHPGTDVRISGKFNLKQLALIFPILLFIALPISWCHELNQSVIFPSGLSGLELWFKKMEDKAILITEAFLGSPYFMDYLTNLIVIGLVAAVGEELLFRGVVQKLCIQMTRNVHVGIWFAAFLFSLMHIQFYGFFPRMFMGALFGYLVVWSGNIGVAMFAHFLFNAVQVTGKYLQSNKKVVEEVDLPGVVWIVLSTVALIGVLYLFKRLGDNDEQVNYEVHQT